MYVLTFAYGDPIMLIKRLFYSQPHYSFIHSTVKHLSFTFVYIFQVIYLYTKFVH